MATDIEAHRVSYEPDPPTSTAVHILKWVAGILAAVTGTLITAGIIGGVIFVRNVDKMSGTVEQMSTAIDSNAAAITSIIESKANKSEVDNRFNEKQGSIDANSARILRLDNRIDRLYRGRKALYRIPLRKPEVRPAMERVIPDPADGNCCRIALVDEEESNT
tara:strand:+ start:103 stop:591 length:489 start_codon:yes stop_codon:yes gene_type:complete